MQGVGEGEAEDTTTTIQHISSSEAPESRSERWARRLETAREYATWLAPKAAPTAEAAAGLAKRTGRAIGWGVKAGGTAVGVGLAGVGVIAVGGPAGACVVGAGAVVAASSFVGGWVTEKVGDGVGAGIGISGVIAERSLRASDGVLGGIHSILTQSQTNYLLGDEGSAVLQHIIDTYQTNLAGNPGFQEASTTELLQGLVSYCALQRSMLVPYGSRGAVKKLRNGLLEDAGPRILGVGAVGERVKEEWGGVGGETEIEREIMRHICICEQTQGALLNVFLGEESVRSALMDANDLLLRNLGLLSSDLLHAQWESRGPHQPCYVVLADRQHGNLVVAVRGSLYYRVIYIYIYIYIYMHIQVVAVRGTLSAFDALTDLRCAYSAVRPTPDEGPQVILVQCQKRPITVSKET